LAVSEQRLAEISRWIDLGYNEAQIAEQFGIKVSTLHRYMRFRNQVSEPKILLFDIETLPMEVLVWGLYRQQIDYQNVLKEWSIVSWAAKWLFGTKIMGAVVSPTSATIRNDSEIIDGIWKLINEADIIIAHNAVKFDVRKLNARFAINGLKRPMPYRVIDTLKETQKHFGFSSHRLDNINTILRNTRKKKTEYGLWKRCAGINTTIKDQNKALKEMLAYNKQDIVALEDLYVEIRPWITSHPNLGLYYSETDQERCPNCGNNKLIWEGYYYTTVGRFRSFRCKKCGAIGRERISDLSKKERLALAAPIAR
jgi:DNA polymerase elongation subunit (family B)